MKIFSKATAVVFFLALCSTVAVWADEEQSPAYQQAPRNEDGMITNYDGFGVDELIKLIEGSDSYVSRMNACANLLQRKLTPEQDAVVRFLQARAYDMKIRRDRAASVMLYEEIIKMHPDFERNVSAAWEIARICDSGISMEQGPDRDKSIQYYEYVVTHADPDKVYLEVVVSNAQLGRLYAIKHNAPEARKHLLAAYLADLTKLEPLPWEKSARTPEGIQQYKDVNTELLTRLQGNIPASFAGTYTGSTYDELLADLDAIARDYAAYPQIVHEALEAKARMAANMDMTNKMLGR